MPKVTKAQLEELVAKYRAENANLHEKLEEHGTPRNLCDDISEFFDDCIETVETAYEDTKNYIFSS